MPRSEIRRGAVLSLNLHGLGDMIFSLPVLKGLKNAGFGPVVSLLWPSLEEMAVCATAVDRAVPLPKSQENEPELGQFVRELAARYDFALCLDFAFMPRAGVISRNAEADLTIGFGHSREDYPWYGHLVPNLHGEHRLERNLHVLDILDLARPAAADSFGCRVQSADEAQVESCLAATGLSPETCPVALHPGSGAAKRNWPAERFAALADRVAEESGAPVVILGGAARTYDGVDESALAARVESLMRTPALNLAGKLGLAGLVALLRRCRLFIGNNSGPAHLAAAVAGTPCLLVWAPRNEWAWRPVGSRVELVFETLDCSPACPLNQCGHMQDCLERVSVESVFARYLDCFAGRGSAALLSGERR
ncbi:glycosyltransferase family 9 protein [bacterium]|nr:glycosyltransferase family 9 protein [bacterium]